MATSNTPNVEALASPIYNPDVDPVSLKLYNIMGNSYPDELVEQYRQVIMGMPTSNPFSGVLINPRACDISEVQTGIRVVTSELETRYSTVVLQGIPVPALTPTGIGPTSNTPGQPGYIPQGSPGYIDPGTPGYVPVPEQAAEAAEWQNTMPAMSAELAQAEQGVSEFQDHTDRTISNLPAILGMVQSALGMASMIGNVLNPCLGVSDFLGSLLAKGKAIMDKINMAIAKVKALIDDVLAKIQAAISYVTSLVQSLIAMVKAEIMALIKSLINAARLGLANLLSGLPKDPCFKSLMGAVGSGAAIAAAAIL